MFGSKPTRPPQDIEESHEDSSLDDIDDDPPNDPFGYGSDNSQHFSFHTNFRDPTFDPGASLHGQGVDIASRDYEGAKSLIELSEWRGIPVIDGIDPTASNHGSGLEPVGNPPATPRPAHRTLSFTANTLPGYQRANETRSRLISQQFAEVQLLLDLRIERRFGSLGNAAPTSLMADNKEIDGKESTSSADAAVALVAIVGGGNLATIDAIGGSVQDTLAATVQNLAANLAEDHSCSSNRLITSIEDIGKGASSSEAENTSKSTTESEDADFGSNAEGLVPLEQVWSRRPSPPQRRYSFGMIDRAE